MRPYLTAMTRLAVWAHREGLPLGVEVLLSHSMLEAHTATLDGSVGTFRSQLRRLAAANGVPVETTGRGFDRPEYSRPYTEVCTQVGGHLVLGDAPKSGGLAGRGFWDAIRFEFQRNSRIFSLPQRSENTVHSSLGSSFSDFSHPRALAIASRNSRLVAYQSAPACWPGA